MKQINLRDLYPENYKEDVWLEVSDEVEEVFQATARAEEAFRRKMYRYKANYSLDRKDGIEYDTLLHVLTPEIIMEKKELKERLYEEVMALPPMQAKRIYARYYLGMSVTEIAHSEGVSKSRISESIQHGLKHLSQKLKNF